MTVYDYPKVSPTTLLKESEDIRTKLDNDKKKAKKKNGPKEESKVTKMSQVHNKLIPDDMLNTHVVNTQFPQNNALVSLSSFLQTAPISTNSSTHIYCSKPKQTVINTNKKGNIQKAILSINDVYEKYKEKYSEEDSKKFKNALDVLSELNK